MIFDSRLRVKPLFVARHLNLTLSGEPASDMALSRYRAFDLYSKGERQAREKQATKLLPPSCLTVSALSLSLSLALCN